MRSAKQTFDAQKSVDTLAKVVAFFNARRCVTQDEVAAHIALSVSRAGDYLRYMADDLDLIHREERPPRKGRGGLAALKWRVGPIRGSKQEFLKKQEIAKVTRDPLMAFFFGIQQ